MTGKNDKEVQRGDQVDHPIAEPLLQREDQGGVGPVQSAAAQLPDSERQRLDRRRGGQDPQTVHDQLKAARGCQAQIELRTRESPEPHGGQHHPQDLSHDGTGQPPRIRVDERPRLWLATLPQTQRRTRSLRHRQATRG